MGAWNSLGTPNWLDAACYHYLYFQPCCGCRTRQSVVVTAVRIWGCALEAAGSNWECIFFVPNTGSAWWDSPCRDVVAKQQNKAWNENTLVSKGHGMLKDALRHLKDKCCYLCSLPNCCSCKTGKTLFILMWRRTVDCLARGSKWHFWKWFTCLETCPLSWSHSVCVPGSCLRMATGPLHQSSWKMH